MQLIRRFFREFDLFAAPATLRIRENTEMKSFPVGVISFLLSCLFLYIFIINCVQMFTYQTVVFRQQETVIPSGQINGSFPMFAISSKAVTSAELMTIFRFKVNIYSQNTLQKTIGVRLCTKDQWAALQDTLDDDFANNNVGDKICPDTTDPFVLTEARPGPNYAYVTMTMTMCAATDAGCNQTRGYQILATNTQMIISVLDSGYYPQAKDAIHMFINSDSRFKMSPYLAPIAQVWFSSYEIDTDTSVLPWQNTQVQTGISIRKFQLFQQRLFDSMTNNVFTITFVMNQNMKILKRTIGKLDGLLSYAGGLFGLVTAFVAFFMMKFNRYRYELKVAEGAFNFSQDGRKIKAQSFNLWTYIKYSLYDWINTITCRKMKWKECNQIDEVREEINSQMEVNRLFKRMENLNTATSHLVDPHEQNCIYLLEPPSLESVKRQKYKLDYYDEIIKGEAAITVEDIKFVDNILTISLEGVRGGGGKKAASEYGTEAYVKIDTGGDIMNEIVPMTREKQIDIVLDRYQVLKQKAQAVELSPQFEQIQKEIAESFFNLDPNIRTMIQEQIPIAIIYRLRKRMKEMKEQTQNGIELKDINPKVQGANVDSGSQPKSSGSQQFLNGWDDSQKLNGHSNGHSNGHVNGENNVQNKEQKVEQNNNNSNGHNNGHNNGQSNGESNGSGINRLDSLNSNLSSSKGSELLLRSDSWIKAKKSNMR